MKQFFLPNTHFKIELYKSISLGQQQLVGKDIADGLFGLKEMNEHDVYFSPKEMFFLHL